MSATHSGRLSLVPLAKRFCARKPTYRGFNREGGGGLLNRICVILAFVKLTLPGLFFLHGKVHITK